VRTRTRLRQARASANTSTMTNDVAMASYCKTTDGPCTCSPRANSCRTSDSRRFGRTLGHSADHLRTMMNRLRGYSAKPLLGKPHRRGRESPCIPNPLAFKTQFVAQFLRARLDLSAGHRAWRCTGRNGSPYPGCFCLSPQKNPFQEPRVQIMSQNECVSRLCFATAKLAQTLPKTSCRRTSDFCDSDGMEPGVHQAAYGVL